jgi:feruloyl-CoA hydratase/lyase
MRDSTFAGQPFRQLAIDLSRGVLTVGLNRPAKKNAIGVEMTLEIERLLQLVSPDPAVQVVVLHGVQGHFSTGMDMKDFFDHSDRGAAELARARQATNHWRGRLLQLLPQPLICAVQGYCLGGAFPLLQRADWVVASDDAVFGLPEINFGFVPGGPIAKSVGLAMNRRGASYASLTGRTFSAAQARQWGLVAHVCPASQCLASAEDAAHQLVAHQAGRWPAPHPQD